MGVPSFHGTASQAACRRKKSLEMPRIASRCVWNRDTPSRTATLRREAEAWCGSRGVRVSDLASAMETIAPSCWAAAWDNVGLLVGDAAAPLAGVLVTIDCTREVIAEARAGGEGSAIVAYHPVLFDARKRFLAGSTAFEAARAGVAVYCPHTALDVTRVAPTTCWRTPSVFMTGGRCAPSGARTRRASS